MHALYSNVLARFTLSVRSNNWLSGDFVYPIQNPAGALILQAE